MSEDISSRERDVLDWLAAQDTAMQDLLATLVNIDSGSYDKEGVDRVGEAVCRSLAAHEIGFEIIAHERFGNAIRARVGTPGNRNILLMGHRDTVFSRGEAGRRPFRAENGRAYGPGVADMKAGLVMNCFVAAAMKKFGAAPAPLVLLFTGDEEIGSPSSRALIEADARRAQAVFNAEPGRPGNAVVTGRKACVFMRFEVTGKAAHAGANFSDGASAIGEMAHKIIALHALTDLAKGITVNVGVAKGGLTINTVAPSASGEMDLRYIDPADRATVLAKVADIMQGSHVPGTIATFETYAEFPPLVQTAESKRIYERYAACAAALGQTVKEIFTGGCSDAGFSSGAGAPTICAVGPIGGGTHSPDEFLELGSMVPRAQTLALTVMRCAPDA